MWSSKGIPEEILMAAIFGEKRWDPRFPLYYPYIVMMGENGEERTLGLTEAIQETLNTLPLFRGRNDPQEWDGYKQVLELRFGLNNGTPRTLEKVGREIGGINQERVRQIEAKALRMMRHPMRSRLLHEFFVLSPEEMARNNKKCQEYQEALQQTLRVRGERIDRLTAILKGYGLREEDFKEVKPEDIPQTAQALKEAREDREALWALKERFPQNLFWNAIARANVNKLSTLRELVENGEIRKVHMIGEKGEKFFGRVLSTVQA